jgi:glycosyltransferase involved in cell wall biosynthesis
MTRHRGDVRVGIVIPCFNEESRLDRAAFERFLAVSDPGVELLLVNDGSADNTLGILRDLEDRFPARVRVIDQQPNQGKAEAVRVGMLQALDGGVDYAGYLDADLATPLEAVDDFVHVLERNPDIDFVIGARVALLGRTIERKAHRHYLGRIFATAASLVLSLPVYDTQCGAKLMRVGPDLPPLFAQRFGSRWIFDVELIARYLTRTDRRDGIYELPLLRWKDVGESRVKPRDFVRAISEMAEIYRTYFLRREQNRWLRLWSAPALRYIGAGGVGTTFHYMLLTALVELWGVGPSIASGCGAILGAIVNYALNYHLTFASKASHVRTAPKFAIVALLSAALNAAGMWLLTDRFAMHYLAAQVVCTLFVLGFGFVVNRAWTFAGGSSDAAAAPVDAAAMPAHAETVALEAAAAIGAPALLAAPGQQSRPA